MPLYSGWCSLALSHLPKTNGHKYESRIPGVFDQEISSHDNFRRDYKLAWEMGSFSIAENVLGLCVAIPEMVLALVILNFILEIGRPYGVNDGWRREWVFVF